MNQTRTEKYSIARSANLRYLLARVGLLPGLIVVLCVLFSILQPAFADIENVLIVLRQMSFLLVLGCGQMLVILTTGVDLSVGSTVGMVSVLAAMFSIQFNIATGFAVALAASIAIGAFNGLIIGYVGVAPFAVTLGTLSIVHALALIITSGQTVYGMPPEYMILGAGYIGDIPIPVVVSIILVAFTWMMLYTTRFGKHLYAAGGNSEAARLSGIDVKKHLLMAYIYCGLFSGISGLMLSSRVNSGSAQLGQAGMMLDSIAVVVIGGVTFSGGEGHLLGVVFGAVLISIMSNGFDLTGVSSFVKMLVTGAVILLAIIVDKYRKTSR